MASIGRAVALGLSLGSGAARDLDCGQAPLKGLPFCDRSLSVEARVEDLASRFTVNETLSQMGMVAAAVPRLGLPALNYGGEALHGVWATCVDGRCPTQFPAPNALGQSFDRDLWEAVGAASGLEARALFRWNLFHGEANCSRSLEGCLGLTFYAPNVNLARDPRWGRVEEVPSEDPTVNGAYGAAFVRGFQGRGAYAVADAVVKHFVAYDLEEDLYGAAPREWCGSAACALPNDRHSFDARVSPRDLEESYVAPFVAPLAAGAAGVMCSYNAVNGEPMCTNRALLRGRLREEMGFEGLLSTDCGALRDAVDHHKRFATDAEAAAAAVEAGVDSECGSLWERALPEALDDGSIRASDLLASLKRLLAARVRLGLLDDHDPEAPVPRPGADVVDSEAHRALALRAAREAVVLLQNDDGLLPLTKTSGRLAVIGPQGNASMNLLSGYHGSAPPDLLRSPLDVLKERWTGPVAYSVGCNTSGPPLQSAMDAAVAVANASDVVVLGLGLCGDNYGGGPPKEDATCVAIDESEGIDRHSLRLPGAQEALFARLEALKKPLVVFLVHAGPVDVSSVVSSGVPMVSAGYGGEFGGVALVDVLLGAYNPGGATTTTWVPDGSLPRYDNMSMRAFPGRTYRFLDERVVRPLFPFGFGLSYTRFSITLSGPKVLSNASAPAVFKAEVTNSGNATGDVVVACFVSSRDGDDRPLKAVFDFDRLRDVAPRETRAFPATLTRDARSFVDDAGARVFPDAGTWFVYCAAGGAATETLPLEVGDLTLRAA